MKCRRVRKHLIPYVEGALSERLTDEVRRHLSECARCAAEMAELAQTVGALREVEYPAMEPAFDLRARVMARISDEPVRRSWWQANKWSFSAVAAALLVFAIVLINVNELYGPAEERAALTQRGKPAAPDSPDQRQSEGLTRQSDKPVWIDGGVKHMTPRSAPLKKEWVRLPGPKPETSPAQTRGVQGRAAGVAGDEMSPSLIQKKMFSRVTHDAVTSNYSDAQDKSRGALTEGTASGYKPTELRTESTGSELGYGIPGPAVTAGAPPAPSASAGVWASREAPPGSSRASTQAPPGGNQMWAAQEQVPPTDFFGGMGNTMRPADGTVAAAERAASAEKKDEVLGLERKLKEYPTSTTVMKQLLSAYREAGRAQDEYAVAVRLSKQYPENAEYWFARAQAAERANMPKTAMNAYRQAIQLKLSGPNLDLAKSRLKALEARK